MSAIEAILGGIILGGLYALVAVGFNLQFGMARIVNLAYGEFLMGAAFAAFWMFTLFSINPIVGMIFSVPVAFGANWLVYRVLMTPLARRARNREQLEGETILATFGLCSSFAAPRLWRLAPMIASTIISAIRSIFSASPSPLTACSPSPWHAPSP